MNKECYKKLNEFSNGEFKNIMKNSPLTKNLNIKFENEEYDFLSKKDENHFTIQTKTNEKKEVFIKYITLVDFLKFLIGKYKNENISILPCEETKDKNSKYENINESNNYAYVDSLFYYVSSVFSKKIISHGINCYDQFICTKKIVK